MPSTRTNLARATNHSLVTAAGLALSANDGRVNGLIQNLSADKLYVKKGLSCSASDFTCILVPGTAADDGYGGTLPLSGYLGPVSIFSAGTVRCMASEDIA